MAKIRINFTIEQDLVKVFRAYCEERHHKMSTIVEKLIREELGALALKKESPPAHHRGIG